MGSSLPAHELVQNNTKHLSIVLCTMYPMVAASNSMCPYILACQRNPLFCKPTPHTVLGIMRNNHIWSPLLLLV